MGGTKASSPDVPVAPPEPEILKQTEAEVTRARGNAKDAARKQYGIFGTNVTKGALADEAVEAKKKTLGGV